MIRNCRIMSATYSFGRIYTALQDGYDWGDGLGARDIVKVCVFDNSSANNTIIDERWGNPGSASYYPAVSNTYPDPPVISMARP